MKGFQRSMTCMLSAIITVRLEEGTTPPSARYTLDDGPTVGHL